MAILELAKLYYHAKSEYVVFATIESRQKKYLGGRGECEPSSAQTLVRRSPGLASSQAPLLANSASIRLQRQSLLQPMASVLFAFTTANIAFNGQRIPKVAYIKY